MAKKRQKYTVVLEVSEEVPNMEVLLLVKDAIMDSVKRHNLYLPKGDKGKIKIEAVRRGA